MDSVDFLKQLRLRRSSLMRTNFQDHKAKSIREPEQLPGSSEEAQNWQEANRKFWEANPMRYDWKEKVGFQEFTEPFYKEIDTRFFSNSWEYMPWKKVPFDTLIDFENLRTKNVLEIGVGNGSHAQLLATHAGSYTGIDLTSYAVKSTSERMKINNLKADIREMDAEQMSFPDETFDFIWTWGVIHHSANTKQIVKEMHRVLKRGGDAIVMVYNRSGWNYYVCGGLIHGLILGNYFKTGSLFKTMQGITDGALARYYTPASWRILVQDLFDVKYVIIKGSKSELFPIPGGKIKNSIMRIVPNEITRFFTNTCRMGSFLISKIEKRP